MISGKIQGAAGKHMDCDAMGFPILLVSRSEIKSGFVLHCLSCIQQL